MAQIEVTTAIRKGPDDILRFLLDYNHLGEFLPSDRFRGYPVGAAPLSAASSAGATGSGSASSGSAGSGSAGSGSAGSGSTNSGNGGASPTPLTRCGLEMQVLNRWWHLQLDASRPGEAPVIHWISRSPVSLDIQFSLSPLKADRRGPKTAVRLHVGYSLPGGLLGRLMDRVLIEREMLKIWDQVIRQLAIALEGKPKSGLKHEDPES